MKTMEESNVKITLIPNNYETVEMVTDQGVEIIQQDFTATDLFTHSIQELERVHIERKRKRTRTLSEDNENDNKEMEKDNIELNENIQEDIIDPRKYYRPMVEELQAGVIELNQMINTIDLIRQREYLTDMQCIRENTNEKIPELQATIANKSMQLNDSRNILLQGALALESTIEKETTYYTGVMELMKSWKICAAIHGQARLPKPFRPGEILAVDCSYNSAGSFFTPFNRSISDIAFAEISRTENGLVYIKQPEEFLSRTLQLRLETDSHMGYYTLPSPRIVKMQSKILDEITLSDVENQQCLEEQNTSILKAAQFSVFCEEVFHQLMEEALGKSSTWTDTVYNINSYRASQANGYTQDKNNANTKKSVSIIQVLDDEIQVRVDENCRLYIKLLDVNAFDMQMNDTKVDQIVDTSKTAISNDELTVEKPTTKLALDPFLSETCRYMLVLLQQELRARQGNKEIARGLLFQNNDGIQASNAIDRIANIPSNNTQNQLASTSHNLVARKSSKLSKQTGILATIVTVLAHTILKNQIATYLDRLSASLAFQGMQVSSSGRTMDQGIGGQPICDSVRGIYICPLWKTCPYDSTRSALELSIGKHYNTEFLIDGTKIRFESAPGCLTEVASMKSLELFIEKTICQQVSEGIITDAVAMGLRRVSMELNRTIVELYPIASWNGTSMGEGRVGNAKKVQCIYIEPIFYSDAKDPSAKVAISCLIQALPPSLQDKFSSSLGIPVKIAQHDLIHINWDDIPGTSDTTKLQWVLETSEYITPPKPMQVKELTKAVSQVKTES